MHFAFRCGLASAALSASLLGLAGCGNAKLPTSLEEAKQAVTQKVETTVENVQTKVETTAAQATATGEFKLNVGQEINAGGCYARLVSFSAGRPAVLQVTSYANSESEFYPSVFVRAQFPQGAPATLAGQVVSAQVYVQEVKDGPVWHSDAPVEIQITAADAATISGHVVSGTLVNTDTGSRADLKGTFKGSIL